MQQPAAPAPEAPPLPLPPVPQNLPITHTPFSPTWPVHNMGPMDIECPYCHALHWKEERLSKSSLRNPTFGKCCLSGKIWLPTLNQPPSELHNLLTSQDPSAKGFHTNIRKYNDALAMTSVSHDLQPIESGGPYVFKVHGSLSHCTGSLLPASDQAPVYAQLYIYDPEDALGDCMGNQHNTSLDMTIMWDLQNMLHCHHHRVALYKTAMELTRDMPPEYQCKIGLCYNPGTDHRHYNLPTMSGEVTVVIPGTGEGMSNNQDIILYHRQGEYHQRISDLHLFYPT